MKSLACITATLTLNKRGFCSPNFSIYLRIERKRFSNPTRATPTCATLPQLLDCYQAASTKNPGSRLNELIRLTYHSTALEGTGLALSQTRNLLQNGQPLPNKSLTNQGQLIDHHQDLEQILALASHHQPLNRFVSTFNDA